MDKAVKILPEDRYNTLLVENVHPPDWANPDPASMYNMVVIGGGTAGLVSAAGAAGLGAKVALVERHLLGGDCLNVGCVPSKALIRSSRVARDLKESGLFGVSSTEEIDVDFPAVMERVRRIRSHISHHDSAKRFSNELGVEIFLGEGQFTGPGTVKVGDSVLRFKKAVIATGASPVFPAIDGIEDVGYLTNETVFSLTERPRNLVVIGGGPIGCELAQAFARLGSHVTIIERGPQFLKKEDADAARILEKKFEHEGIEILLGTQVTSARSSEGRKILEVTSDRGETEITADEILIGIGRAPNVEGLGLEAVSVEYDPRRGIKVNDRMQTTNKNIYAAGDICMQYKFTHAADAAARIVIQNALFMGRKKLSAVTIPWTTFTDPEIAHVGLNERMAESEGVDIDTFTRQLSEVDRAIADGEEEGFVKIHVRKGSDRIAGATIVAKHAGEMINEITVAMVNGIGLGSLAGVIHPYPTQAEAIRHVADQYNRTRLTPRVRRIFDSWLRWVRK